jgi:hypothetical protein
VTNGEALRRAAKEERASLARTLIATAAFALAAGGDRLTLVGGAASNLYTGTYRPTDVDLVGVLVPDAGTRLEDLGFRREGRHWIHRFEDGEEFAFEIVADGLFALATEPPEIVDVAGTPLRVIALDDLMMDRLLQATGGEAVTRQEAVSLAVAAYDRIDWPSLERRIRGAAGAGGADVDALPEVLGDVRRAARRALRDGQR